ncbi:hypothetical protein SK128_019132 [Halocaridina rubra]|uniref:Uncharacterized protein n=1 Tax=Halocaridina rubra TaxID=373956 RepID=A0AAN9ACG6_HALRR
MVNEGWMLFILPHPLGSNVGSSPRELCCTLPITRTSVTDNITKCALSRGW